MQQTSISNVGLEHIREIFTRALGERVDRRTRDKCAETRCLVLMDHRVDEAMREPTNADGKGELLRLCAICEVEHQIRNDWRDLIHMFDFGRFSKNAETVVALHPLPLTLRTLLLRHSVHTLCSKNETTRIAYLTRIDLLEMQPVFKRVLAYVKDSMRELCSRVDVRSVMTNAKFVRC